MADAAAPARAAPSAVRNPLDDTGRASFEIEAGHAPSLPRAARTRSTRAQSGWQRFRSASEFSVERIRAKGHGAAVVVAVLAVVAGAFFAGFAVRGATDDADGAGASSPPAARAASALKAGTVCGAHAHCSDTMSLCLNWAPHTPPFVCEADSAPACHADHTPACEAMRGFAYEVSCEADGDCPSGAVCQHEGTKQDNRPRFCVPSGDAADERGDNGFVCACDCVSNWIGDTCGEWNATVGDGGVGAAPGRRAQAGAASEPDTFQMAQIQTHADRIKDVASAAAPSSFIQPFNGGLGYGYSILDNELKPGPLIALSYTDGNEAYRGHRLPTEANVQIQAAFDASVTTGVYATFGDLVADSSSTASDILGAGSPSTLGNLHFGDGITAVSYQPTAFTSMFRGDDAVGVAESRFMAFSAAFKDGDGSTQTLTRVGQYALATLPTGAAASSASGAAAYDTFVSTYGSNFVVSAENGGSVGLVSEYPFQLLRDLQGASSDWQSEANAVMTAEFTVSMGVSATGAKASASATASAQDVINEYATYKDSRKVNRYCQGGDPTKCNEGDYDKWASSVWDAPEPMFISTMPISALPGVAAQKDGLDAAISRALNKVTSAVDVVNACDIPCGHGRTCENNQNYCDCETNELGRLCKTCTAGYGAAGSCAAAECSQCNAGGGTCTAPNHCSCASCYSGSDCGTYTCGCFDAEGIVSVLRGYDGVARDLRLSEVRVGDRVLSVDGATGVTVFSDVYYAAVAKEGPDVDPAAAEMATIEVAGGQQLHVTADHLVYLSLAETAVSASAANRVAVAAREVVAGDQLWTYPRVADGTELTLRRVVSVRVAPSSVPLMTVHTLAGPIIVDGVLASSYEWSESWGEAENADDRWLYTIAPYLVSSQWYQAHAQWWDAHVTVTLLDPAAKSVHAAWAAVRSWASTGAASGTKVATAGAGLVAAAAVLVASVAKRGSKA